MLRIISDEKNMSLLNSIYNRQITDIDLKAELTKLIDMDNFEEVLLGLLQAAEEDNNAKLVTIIKQLHIKWEDAKNQLGRSALKEILELSNSWPGFKTLYAKYGRSSWCSILFENTIHNKDWVTYFVTDRAVRKDLYDFVKANINDEHFINSICNNQHVFMKVVQLNKMLDLLSNASIPIKELILTKIIVENFKYYIRDLSDAEHVKKIFSKYSLNKNLNKLLESIVEGFTANSKAGRYGIFSKWIGKETFDGIFTQGATIGTFNNLPPELSSHLSSFLSGKEGRNLALTSNAGARAANAEIENKIENMLKIK